MEQILMSNRNAIEIREDSLGAGPSAGLCFRVVSSWKVLGPGQEKLFAALAFARFRRRRGTRIGVRKRHLDSQALVYLDTLSYKLNRLQPPVAIGRGIGPSYLSAPDR
jgi:hypothetical protein